MVDAGAVVVLVPDEHARRPQPARCLKEGIVGVKAVAEVLDHAAVIARRVSQHRHALFVAVLLAAGDGKGMDGDVVEGQRWHRSARCRVDGLQRLRIPRNLIGIDPLSLHDAVNVAVVLADALLGCPRVSHRVTAVRVEQHQHPGRDAIPGQGDAVVAVAGDRSPGKATVLRPQKLRDLPAHAHIALVVVVAEDGRPRDAEGVHQLDQLQLKPAGVVELAVDVVASQYDHIRPRLRDQLADIAVGAGLHLGLAVLEVGALDLPVAGRVAGGGQVDGLHVGQLQDADRLAGREIKRKIGHGAPQR